MSTAPREQHDGSPCSIIKPFFAGGAQLHFGRGAPRLFGRLSGPERGPGDCGLPGGGLRVRVLHEPRLGVLRGQQGLLRTDAGKVPAKDDYTAMKCVK